jgi:hypothetical protein
LFHSKGCVVLAEDKGGVLAPQLVLAGAGPQIRERNARERANNERKAERESPRGSEIARLVGAGKRGGKRRAPDDFGDTFSHCNHQPSLLLPVETISHCNHQASLVLPLPTATAVTISLVRKPSDAGITTVKSTPCVSYT